MSGFSPPTLFLLSRFLQAGGRRRRRRWKGGGRSLSCQQQHQSAGVGMSFAWAQHWPKGNRNKQNRIGAGWGIFWSLGFQFLMSTSGVSYSALPWSSLLNNQQGSPVWKQTNTVNEERRWLFSTSARRFLTSYGRKHIIMKTHLFVFSRPLAFPPVQRWQLRVAAVCGN